MTNSPASVQRVIDAAAVGEQVIEVIEYPDGTSTAQDAAAAVECEVGQIVKSLIFSVSDELVLALTSGANKVDTTALAAVAGGERCDRADADQVRAITGYAIGGVPPFGHASPVRSFFDPDLLTHEVVWAAAGTPRHVFAMNPQHLLDLTGATKVDFT